MLPEEASRSITWTGSGCLPALESSQPVGLNWSARMERISDATWIKNTDTRSGIAHPRSLSIVLTRADQTPRRGKRLRQAIDEFA